MFHTTTGGQQWIDQTFPCLQTCVKPTDLLRIRFTDPKTGWIVGERGVIYRTVDGGFSWTEQENGAKQSLFGLSFADPAHGWASGERGVILQIIPKP
jgi:photosystem II stability/assembly factor-like uncharacterized protein